jgi:hypothetical protein
MKAKETHVARGASPFTTKAGASLIPSPITKVCTSPFIMKVGASPIPNIERHVLERNILVSYALYKARSQLGQNSGCLVGQTSWPADPTLQPPVSFLSGEAL